MTLIQSIILGAIQGFTEFLPISSSGHLVLAKSFMNIHTGKDISFEVFVHFGTFLSVLIVFKDDLMKIAGAVASGIKERARIAEYYRKSEYFRLALYVVIGCIPAGVVGGLFNDRIEEMFESPRLVSAMLLITGAFLYSTRFARPAQDKEVSLRSSVRIGLVQAVAVVPGISRSGSTIACALLLGVSQERAARFSFLMAIPVIFGATILKARHLIAEPPAPDQIQALAAGTVVAALTGYVALRVLLRVLRSGKFSLFSYYCLAAGLLGILFIS